MRTTPVVLELCIHGEPPMEFPDKPLVTNPLPPFSHFLFRTRVSRRIPPSMAASQ